MRSTDRLVGGTDAAGLIGVTGETTGSLGLLLLLGPVGGGRNRLAHAVVTVEQRVAQGNVPWESISPSLDLYTEFLAVSEIFLLEAEILGAIDHLLSLTGEGVAC